MFNRQAQFNLSPSGRLKAAAAVVLACSLSGCGAGLMMLSMLHQNSMAAAKAPAEQPPEASFSVEMPDDTSLPLTARRLSSYASECWVRDDPNYRVGGPFADGEAQGVRLIYLDNGAPLEALRITLTKSAQGAQAVAAGPLAAPEHEETIRAALKRVAHDKPGCA